MIPHPAFSMHTSVEFKSKWRSFLWPIHAHELRRLLPMLAMFFLVVFNYNLLRNAKDTALVTAAQGGAEAIPFVKIWVVPCAVGAAILFYKVSQRFRREQVFTGVFGLFLGYLLLFTCLLQPFAEQWHLHGVADWMQSWMPAGFHGLAAVIRYWAFSSYYIIAELWSSLVVAVLLWGFVNEVTTVHEAKRFYGLLGVGAHVSGIAAGGFAILLSELSHHRFLPFATSDWSQSLYLINITSIFCGATVLGLFWWMHRYVLAKQPPHDPSVEQLKKEELKRTGRPKMSLRHMFSYLVNSPYLLCIATMVMSYNVCINLAETLWKNQVRMLYPESTAYSAFMGQVTIATDILATIIGLFLCSNLIRRRGWTAAALSTPLVMLCTSGLFLFCLLTQQTEWGQLMAAWLGATPLSLTVLSGAILISATRASKFAMFDTTKEMAFVPLNRESKLKGKAAIDGIGSRVGKSAGAAACGSLVMVCSSLAQAAPYIAILLPCVIGVWLVAVQSLGRRFQALTTPPTSPVVTSTTELTAKEAPLPQPVG